MKKAVLSVCAVLLFAPAVAGAKIGGGNIVFRVSGAGNVVYSHEFHVVKAGLKCTNCHYRIFPMAKNDSGMTMEAMENGRYCGACHNGTKAFDVKAKANCAKCHQ